MANNTTYMTIPPPPLPEFYLPRIEKPSTPATGDGADVEYSIRYERRSELARGSAMPGDGADDRMSFTHTMTADAPSRSNVPTLAIYHICRVCLRPRSARYHQEHPVPEDGLPPPPGICRRCRVTPAEETRKVTHIVEEHDSNDIKLGIRAFVPDEDYYSNQEMREKRAEYLLSHAEWQEIEPPPKKEEAHDSREQSYRYTRVNVPPPPSSVEETNQTRRQEYIYKHVHVEVPPPPPPQSRPASPKRKEHVHRHIHVGVPPPPLAMPSPPSSKAGSDSTAQDAIDALAKKPKGAKMVSKEVDARYKQWSSVPPPPPIISAGAQATSKEVNVRGTVTRDRAVSTTSDRKASSKQSSSRKTAPSEAEIRRLARDEVIRYRQAERKLEAHADPYAHGKMVPIERVPVERRIETVRDVAEEKPWARPSEPARRDSGIAMRDHVRVTKHKEEEKKEVVVVQEDRTESRSIDTRQQRAVSPPPSSSSTSSTKTIWPQELVERPVRNDKDVSEVRGIALDSSGRQVGPRFGIRKIDLPDRNHDIAEFSEHWDQSGEATKMRYVPVRKDDQWATELAQDFDRVTQTPAYPGKPESLVSKWTSQDYWNEESAAKTAVSRSTRKSNLKAEKPPRGQQYESDERGPQKGARQVTSSDDQIITYERRGTDRLSAANETPLGKLGLPYPQEDAMPISMPSPRSHMSNRDSLGHTAPRTGDKEWIYMRRTVQPADSPWDEHAFDDDRRSDLDYKETTERLVHRKARQDSTKTITPPSKRRASDVSSRVRFSSKLDVSPTPPDSDASSSEFRKSGMMRHQHDGPASNNIEKADRGRSRSRTVTRGDGGYYYERDTVRTREREYHEADRDRTPRPSDRGRRRSGTSETATGLSTLPSDIRPLARAFSESPSRETLRDTARRQKLQQRPDSKGPYTVEHSRSDSVEAFDGSTITASSRCSSDRERRVRRKEGGRGGRR